MRSQTSKSNLSQNKDLRDVTEYFNRLSKGQFLAHLVREAVSGPDSPGEQEVAGLVRAELLRMAKAWKRDPEVVMRTLGGR